MTPDEALHQARRVHRRGRLGVLEMFAPRRRRARRASTVVPSGTPAARGRSPVPAVAATVSYVDGVTGGNVFVDHAPGARAWPRR